MLLIVCCNDVTVSKRYFKENLGMKRTDLKRYHMLQDNSVSLYAQRSGNQGNSWQFLELQFTTSVSEKIYIEGVQGTNFNGDIAIDDIKLLNSNCPNTA